jgi:adenine-specific DNA-methyltransferase
VSIAEQADVLGRSFTEALPRDEQRRAGQFMTPLPLARFMARRLVAGSTRRRVHILEPSAGAGVLLAATVEALLEKAAPPMEIQATAFEIDARLVEPLEGVCVALRELCATRGIRFAYRIQCEDFLSSALARDGVACDGLLTIANPPFFKLNKEADPRARYHSYAVHGQPNAYGLFMAATARLTPADGRWCFVVPRSWMNGSYFRAVRRTMLDWLSIESLHVFGSRRESFEADAVLQETVVVWASGRGSARLPDIHVTRSRGVSDLAGSTSCTVVATQVIDPDHSSVFRLPTSSSERMRTWKHTLGSLGLKVSTGPVVAFRAAPQLTEHAGDDTVPLLWLQHVTQQRICWPIAKKREHVRVTPESRWMLVRNLPMVILRRFSPKEDPRRVTSAAYLGELPGTHLGLENHLNYIQRSGGELRPSEAKGLAAVLASGLVDEYLRGVAGSTQINAAELRRLPLPDMDTLADLGDRLPPEPSLAEIDEAVEALISNTQQRTAA